MGHGLNAGASFVHRSRCDRLDLEEGFGVEAQPGSQGGTVDGEESEVGSGAEGEVEGKAEGRGLAEGLLGPVGGSGLGVGEGEEVEEEGAGSGFLEVGPESGDEGAELGLAECFEGGIGREKEEMRTAGESAGGGEAGRDPVAGSGLVDGEESGRLRRVTPWQGSGVRGPGARGRIGHGADESSGTFCGLGVFAKEDGEREGRNVEGGVQGKVGNWGMVS